MDSKIFKAFVGQFYADDAKAKLDSIETFQEFEDFFANHKPNLTSSEAVDTSTFATKDELSVITQTAIDNESAINDKLDATQVDSAIDAKLGATNEAIKQSATKVDDFISKMKETIEAQKLTIEKTSSELAKLKGEEKIFDNSTPPATAANLEGQDEAYSIY